MQNDENRKNIERNRLARTYFGLGAKTDISEHGNNCL